MMMMSDFSKTFVIELKFYMLTCNDNQSCLPSEYYELKFYVLFAFHYIYLINTYNDTNHQLLIVHSTETTTHAYTHIHLAGLSFMLYSTCLLSMRTMRLQEVYIMALLK